MTQPSPTSQWVTPQQPGSRPPGRSPLRVLLTFVLALGVVLLVVGAVAVALAPARPAPECPDPSQVCGRPPTRPTLPPASLTAASPPAARPPASLPVASQPSASPPPASAPPPSQPGTSPALTTAPASPAATAVPPPSPSGAPASGVPSLPPAATPVPPTTAPTTAPTTGTGFVVPAPRPATGAAPYRAFAVWRSTAYGFSFEYDDTIWTIRQESPRGVQLLAARGNVSLSIGAFPAAERGARDLYQDEIARLEGLILGFTEEPDPALQLPGVPTVAYRVGFGGAFAGTLNSPQGPSVNVNAAVLTAGDERITVLVTVVTAAVLRPAAFSVADSVLNTFRWSEAEN